MRLFLALALAVLSALGITPSGPPSHIETRSQVHQALAGLGDGDGDCKRCHANGEGYLAAPSPGPRTCQDPESGWDSAVFNLPKQDLRHRLEAARQRE